MRTNTDGALIDHPATPHARVAALLGGVLALLLLAPRPADAQFCSSAADCDDGIGCTVDTCPPSPFFRLCRHVPDGQTCKLDWTADSSATCDTGNDDEHSCVFTESVGLEQGGPVGLHSRYGWSLCADPNATHDRSVSGTATHDVTFDVTTPGGYRLDVTHAWKGYMKADASSAFGGTVDANVSAMTGQYTGPGVPVPGFVPDATSYAVPGLPDPGDAHMDAADIGTDGQGIDASTSFSIWDRSRGQPRSHQLSFTWDGHARGEEGYASIRLGEAFWDPSQEDGGGDCLYPGSPSRTRVDDGHVVDVVLVPLCGNGQIDPEVGEECDPNDPNRTTCCTSSCTICCGNGVVDPGETCDPSIPGTTCPLDCAAKDFTADDWQTSALTLVDAAFWADDASSFFDPIRKRLRLTGNHAGERGAAWFSKRVDPSRDWSTDFTYQGSFAANGGADGVALLFQRDNVAADYQSGVDSAPTATPYLSIGLDTFLNQGLDAYPDSLEVHVNGTFPGPDGSPTQGLQLSNDVFTGCSDDLLDCYYTVYARYTAATQTLVVTVDSPNHPGSVSGTWHMDLGTLLGHGQRYWVGFAANTGGSAENHDVVRWAFQFEEACGNGVVDAGEQCDAGAANGTPGACCSGGCMLAQAGHVCLDDGNPCTDDVCDGASSSCTHPPNAAPCDDGVFCNGADVCRDGACALHAGDPCPGPDGDANCAESCDEAAKSCTAPDPAGSTCRAAAGPCDVVERCDGTSAACPADGFLDAGTSCRAPAGPCDVAESCTGSAAACPRDALAPPGTACRAAAGDCDVAATCTGADPVCPPNTNVARGVACTPDDDACTTDACDGAGACTHVATADSDGDGICDAADPCTDVGGTQRFLEKPASKLVVSRIDANTIPDDDGVVLQGTFDLPAGHAFAELDPAQRGLRLVLEARDGASHVDVRLATGTWTGKGTRGWKHATNGRRWSFLDQTAVPADGIVKVTLQDVAKDDAPRRVRVKVTGKDGSYPFGSADVPLAAAVTLGGATEAAAGLCAESAFAPSDCVFNKAGTTVACRR